MLEQLVARVSPGRVSAQGLTPELDQELMYRLMNLPPAALDFEDYKLPAYQYFCSENDDVAFSRSFVTEAESCQTNFIVGKTDDLKRFRDNPALFNFIAGAHGLFHDEDRFFPDLPELDFSAGQSQFMPVFEDDQAEQLAQATLAAIENYGQVAVFGVRHPFRFLIPALDLMDVEQRLSLKYSVNSAYLPKTEVFNLMVFPTMSSAVLNRLDEAKIKTLSIKQLKLVGG